MGVADPVAGAVPGAFVSAVAVVVGFASEDVAPAADGDGVTLQLPLELCFLRGKARLAVGDSFLLGVVAAEAAVDAGGAVAEDGGVCPLAASL